MRSEGRGERRDGRSEVRKERSDSNISPAAITNNLLLLASLLATRDDVVFAVFLYQRWIYDVDMERPYQGDGGGKQEKDNAKKDN